ncbi:MAG: chorismate mutase [Candidatus Gastranaerophilales bacterium]|nr:chorismate mutase [Candidatus Gastranaerophilales bacterium]
MMYQRGVRGAVTVENNSPEALKSAVVELISSLINANNLKEEDISHVIYTLTDDIDCVYPAKIVRDEFPKWKYIPMMCVSEMKIKNSLEKCLRILIVINTTLAQQQIKHVYLKGAEKLRQDLK